MTSIIKITQLPSISKSTFTESTTQLVILAAAEGAITIIAASIPILRALLRDTTPAPGPAEFYHDMEIGSGVYAGTVNSRGTGRSSTVISSAGNHSRSTSRCSKETRRSDHRPNNSIGHLRKLSALSRFSGLSMGFGGTRSGPHHRNESADCDNIDEFLPPGKIVQTEEVVVDVEYLPLQVQDNTGAAHGTQHTTASQTVRPRPVTEWPTFSGAV